MSHRKMLIFFVTILFMMSMGMGCCRKEAVVVQMGRFATITLDEFRKDFSNGKSIHQLKVADLSQMKTHLNKMIDDRIRLMAAYEYHLDKDIVLSDKLAQERRQLLINRLYQKEIVECVIKETDIRDFYARMGKEVIIRKILFKLIPRADDKEKEAIRKRALEVLGRIKNGEDFSFLAREFSDDKRSAIRGGLMNPLTWTRSSDPVLKKAFSMKVSEISDLIETRAGYCIIRVEEVRSKKPISYEAARGDIIRKLTTEKRDRLISLANDYWKFMMEKEAVEWNENELTVLADRFRAIPNPRKQILIDTLSEMSADEQEIELVHYCDGSYKVKDIKVRLQAFPEHTLVPLGNPKQLKNIIERWLMSELLSKNAIEKGMQRDRIFQREFKKILEKEMVRSFVERKIWRQISPSNKTLKKYFEMKGADRYCEPERVKIQEIMVKDKKLALQIVSWARSDSNFSRLARRFSVRPGLDNEEGIIGYFSRGMWGKVGEEAFHLSKGEIAGPIPHEKNMGYSIIKLLDRKLLKMKNYNDVKDQVLQDYQKEHENLNESEWLHEKRNEMNFTVYDGVLLNAFKNI